MVGPLITVLLDQSRHRLSFQFLFVWVFFFFAKTFSCLMASSDQNSIRIQSERNKKDYSSLLLS